MSRPPVTWPPLNGDVHQTWPGKRFWQQPGLWCRLKSRLGLSYRCGPISTFMRSSRNARVRVAVAIRSGALGVAAILLGLAYLPANEPTSLPYALQLISADVPLAVWAYAWIAAGSVALVGLVRQHPVWSAGVVGMMVAWGLAYLVSYLLPFFGLRGDPRYVGALLYLLFAVVLLTSAYIASIALDATRRAEPSEVP